MGRPSRASTSPCTIGPNLFLAEDKGGHRGIRRFCLLSRQEKTERWIGSWLARTIAYSKRTMEKCFYGLYQASKKFERCACHGGGGSIFKICCYYTGLKPYSATMMFLANILKQGFITSNAWKSYQPKWSGTLIHLQFLDTVV